MPWRAFRNCVLVELTIDFRIDGGLHLPGIHDLRSARVHVLVLESMKDVYACGIRLRIGHTICLFRMDLRKSAGYSDGDDTYVILNHTIYVWT